MTSVEPKGVTRWRRSRDCGKALIPGVMALQLGPRLVERDRRWHCQRTYQLSFPQVGADIFFMDTSAFRASYRDSSWAAFPGGLLQQSWPVSPPPPPPPAPTLRAWGSNERDSFPKVTNETPSQKSKRRRQRLEPEAKGERGGGGGGGCNSGSIPPQNHSTRTSNNDKHVATDGAVASSQLERSQDLIPSLKTSKATPIPLPI